MGRCLQIIDSEYQTKPSEITGRRQDRLFSFWGCGSVYLSLDGTRSIVTAEMLMTRQSFTSSLIERQSLSGREEDDVSNLDDDVDFEDCPQASDGGRAENALVYLQLSNPWECDLEIIILSYSYIFSFHCFRL